MNLSCILNEFHGEEAEPTRLNNGEEAAFGPTNLKNVDRPELKVCNINGQFLLSKLLDKASLSSVNFSGIV